VDFNPTPTRPLVLRPQDDSEFATPEEKALLGEDDGSLSLLSDFEVDPFAGSTPGAPLAGGGNELLSKIVSIFATLATLVVVLGIATIVAGIGVRMWWEYRFRRMPADIARWAKLLDLAGWAGVAPLSTRTPLEAARELRASTELTADLTAIARAYTRRRYGRHDDVEVTEGATPEVERHEPTEADRALDATYVEARNRLLRTMIGRLLPSRHAAKPLPSTIAIRN
jgi:hypothetical protein